MLNNIYNIYFQSLPKQRHIRLLFLCVLHPRCELEHGHFISRIPKKTKRVLKRSEIRRVCNAAMSEHFKVR